MLIAQIGNLPVINNVEYAASTALLNLGSWIGRLITENNSRLRLPLLKGGNTMKPSILMFDSLCSISTKLFAISVPHKSSTLFLEFWLGGISSTRLPSRSNLNPISGRIMACLITTSKIL